MRRIVIGGLVTLGVVVLAAGSAARAFAQEAATTPEPGAASAEVDTHEAESPQVAEAMQRFADANALFERGDHEGALSEMQRVYELLEGNESQYIVLYNLGRVYEELFQYDRAIGLYERYLAESPPDASDRADAQASLHALERLLGTIAITTNAEGGSVWIGDQEVGTAPGELRVAAGHHVLEVRAEGFESSRQEIDVPARGRLALDVQLSRLSDFHGLSPAVIVTTGAAAIVALGVAIGVGLYALQLSNDSGACGMTPGCTIPGGVDARRQQIRDLALAADVTYGVAGLFAVASVVLAFLTDWGGHESATATTARLWPTLGGAMLDVRF